MPDAHLERLLTELGARAGAEIAQVEADARARADAIRARCAAAVDARRAVAIATVDADLARRRTSALAEARRRGRGAVLRAQHALVDLVVERIRQQAARQFAQPESERGFSRRCAILRSYAVSADASVERVASGLRLTADDGHLSIDDTVDAWLDADRAAIAIDVCHAVERASC